MKATYKATNAVILLLLTTLSVFPLHAQTLPATPQKKTAPTTGTSPEKDGPASAELREMVKMDQDDRAWFLKGEKLTEVGEKRMVMNDAKRLARVRELVRQDKLVTAADFDNAALLFQHGDTTDDILAAHELSFVGLLKATKRIANNLPVLAQDRFLERIGRKQRFGSQGRPLNAPKTTDSQITEVDEDGDLAVTDALRADLFMPPLAASKEKGSMAIMDYIEPISARLKQRYDPVWQAEQAKRPEAQELQRLAEAEVTDANIARVLALYRADGLRTPADYANAATVLLHTVQVVPNTPNGDEQLSRRLLLAHELATVAALRKHPAGPELFAQTWDCFLVAVGQSQRYGTFMADKGLGVKFAGGIQGTVSRPVMKALNPRPFIRPLRIK